MTLKHNQDTHKKVPFWTRLRDRTRYLFDLDPRSMGLFRILFGSSCLADLYYRIPYLQMMYSSSGWHPNGWVVNHFGIERPHALSLLHLINTTTSIHLFFGIAMVCAFLFTIGYKTKLFQGLTAICMISIHNRNGVLQNGGDIVHNLWWMWTIFLPLGRRWSLDALIASWQTPDTDDQALNRHRKRDVRPYTTFAAVAIILNLSLCYFLNGMHKNGLTWLSGDAVALTLEQDRILRPLGAFVREYFPLWTLRLLTWSTLIAEATAPIFLLSPWFSVWSRRIILLTLAGFHIGVGLTLQLGFFSLWMMVIYFIILRSEDMDLLGRWFKPRAKPLTVYYDSDCGVCHAFARLFARLDAYRLITWVGRGQPTGQVGGLEVEGFNQLREETLIAHMTDDKEHIWTHHQAVAEVLKRVPFLTPIAWGLILTGPLGRWVYTHFALRRHKVSQWLGYGVCGISPPSAGAKLESTSNLASIEYWQLNHENGPKRLWRRLTRGMTEFYIILAFIAAFYTAIYSNRYFKPMPKPVYPQWARSFVTYGQFYQSWRLFSPEAPYEDGWMILEATLADGRTVDMRTGKEPSYDVPHYKNRTWGFYEARWGFKLRREARTLWPLFVNWVKRPVQRLRLSPKERVNELNFYWVADRTQPPLASGLKPPTPQGKKLIRSWSRAAEKAIKHNQ